MHLQRVSSDVEGGVGVVGQEGELGEDGLDEGFGGAAAGSGIENSLDDAVEKGESEL